VNGIRAILRGMSDVEGVIGSFVVSDAGGLIDTDLPATFDASVFAEAGPRLVRLADLGTTFGEDFRFLVLRFDEHKLYVRAVSGAFLGVILSLEASVPSLKAAANLVARRIEAELTGRRTAAPLADVTPVALEMPISLTQTLPSITHEDLRGSIPPPPPASEPPVSTGPRRTVRFRGRAMD
jgi:predicted regulator of Ras-like GTPase activity (Roadblock/LC7/MglB family)